ncbi:DUF4123 domain-containing protein [Photobacterium kishitanii]|uniref:DUF4123 domain-containing protein n=1 Tax=Photobacterium kishitanii TaxID=318456 RepID=UPI0007EFDC41|nr:DUF4123 domain-containing protein [Photobacterium kishitanii]OBU20474.1 hypothetical protein AYY22_09040 [Photobacterium kishitanii]PSW70861.1 DUF4123 domain-containing protein [Photobacterium kishitanii]
MILSSLLPQLQQAIDNKQNIFAVLNKTSDSNPLMHFSSSDLSQSEPLWLGTQYREWFDVMPVLIQVPLSDPFIEWLEQARPIDWGLFVVSPFNFEDVYQYLQSLTQVWLPNGRYCFFRFFDPRFSIPIVQLCNDEQRAELMGPTSQWLSYSHQVVRNDEISLGRAREFPWWNVPEHVLKKFKEEDKSTLIKNSLQWLKESHADIYYSFSEKNVEAKIKRLVERYRDDFGTLNTYIKNALDKEVYR